MQHPDTVPDISWAGAFENRSTKQNNDKQMIAKVKAED
jgi:hypothetical protein